MSTGSPVNSPRGSPPSWGCCRSRPRRRRRRLRLPSPNVAPIVVGLGAPQSAARRLRRRLEPSVATPRSPDVSACARRVGGGRRRVGRGSTPSASGVVLVTVRAPRDGSAARPRARRRSPPQGGPSSSAASAAMRIVGGQRALRRERTRFGLSPFARRGRARGGAAAAGAPLPGRREDRIDEVGLLQAGDALHADRARDRVELLAVLAIEHRSLELLLGGHGCLLGGSDRGRRASSSPGMAAC